jgi:1-deoxy-D-xylulose 5-phosphate reductoisomerase
VAAFLAEKIRFIDIQNTLLKVMDRYENTALNTIEDVFAADAAARRMTEEVLSSL